MTTAKFTRAPGENRLIVRGHQPGKKGQDIYCAAASAITCALAAGLAQDKDIEMVQTMTEGRMEITANRTARGDAMFDMARAGFETMAWKWPERYMVV